MISWLRDMFFPSSSDSFKPEEMATIMNYQDRLARARGEDYTMERQMIVGVKIMKVAEGEYIYPYPASSLHYTEAERPGLAFYQIPAKAPAKPETVVVKYPEPLNTPRCQRLDELCDLFNITWGANA